MNKPTVSLETARRLAEAGFLPPKLEVGQFVFGSVSYEGGELEHIPLCTVVEETQTRRMTFRRLTCEMLTGQTSFGMTTFAPTALDIIKQMPSGTRLVWHNEAWICAWDLDYIGASIDNREDECPHECAAKAFLAWKAGNS